MELDQISGMFGARQMRNCLPCKKRKIKCDRRIPCGPCALRRDGKSCTPAVGKMEDVSDEGDAYVSSRDFRLLARHVEALQAKVEALERRAGGVSGPSGTSGTGDKKGDVKRKAGADGDEDGAEGHRSDTPDDGESPPLIRSRKHIADDEMVFALEDFQMSHRINSLRNLGDSPVASTPGQPHTAGTRISKALQNIDFEPVNFTDDHPLAFIIPPDTDYIGKALEQLPDQATCELLTQTYFDNVEWLQRCLHYPTFMRQCRQLWRGERDQLSPAFICSYIMVICLGLRTVADSLPGMANALTLADKLYRVAEGVLWCSRFMSRHTFESLQAISLLTVYGFAMDDGGDGTWTLCGAAIKIGQNLGLNRLEAEGKNKDWDPQWNSLLKREMARRVWWTFVSLDWSHAISHGSTYSIHPDQNTTALPSNLDDDQLEDENAVPHPLSVYTPISMQICRIKFVELYRQITDHMASRSTPSYSFILSMDDAIIELANSLPKHFGDPAQLSPDTDRRLVIDSIFLNVTANTRLVRLHRPFFLRGYHDKRYARSKDRCVRASHVILSLLDLAKTRAPVLLSFWIVLFYAFSAAVPVCIDLLLEPTDEKRRAAQTILETFRKQSVTSPAARNSVFVIERLLEAEESFREHRSDDPSNKRHRLNDGSPASAASSASKHEQVKAMIRSILESTAFRREPPPQQPAPNVVLPDAAVPPPVAMSHPAIPRLFDPLSPALNLPVDSGVPPEPEPVPLDSGWPAFSFDMFDTLWTQTDNAWPVGTLPQQHPPPPHAQPPPQ